MENESLRCMSIESKDLYAAMNLHDETLRGYNIRYSTGEINLNKFSNAFDYSLDMIRLRDVYTRKTRRRDFAFKSGRHQYTKNVICVTFKYSYKDFNLCGRDTYVKAGYSITECDFVDSVALKDDELIGIKLNADVETPVSPEILGEYFIFDGGVYKQTKDFKTLLYKSDLREYLYKNGFTCDGVEYVRYKRSSGSSRVGKCLFVNKLLADDMSEWDRCGLPLKAGDAIDLAGWEAYISLPLSSIIDTVEILPENILVIEDFNSVFVDDVIAVSIKDDHLFSEEASVPIENCIWDGQSLMDKSLFGKYEDKGMLLLRNRFFKSCCFNTNLQQWFADNGVTEVSQLNGYTRAQDVSQIKLITTRQSIKYVKFGTLDMWFDNLYPIFGVVKYEKKPKPFGGRFVQAHYQLFNTLQLSYDEICDVLKDSFDYISGIRNDPAVLRYAIHYPVDDGTGTWGALDSKNEIIFKLLGINEDFAKTKLYANFRDSLIKCQLRNLKRGHVLIPGNYSTMMGNGMEMLLASIGKFDGTPVLGVGNIHSKRFAYGERILCSRSPHVTVGNILLVNNIANDDIDKYFNLTPEIVCINSINENILQRLNGSDFDSDTVLMTNHPLLIEAAERNYNAFKVPTNMTTSVKTKRYYTPDDKADLDVKTSVNKIGEIINLSQQLNSLMWERINRGASIESCKELYMDICKLAVLSNVEIDRAKREFVIVSSQEIDILKQKYKITDDQKTVKPMFFKMITLENNFQLSDNIKYRYFDTSMDYLQRAVARFKFYNSRLPKTYVDFMDIIVEPDVSYGSQGYYYLKAKSIFDTIKRAHAERNQLYIGYDTSTKQDKEAIWQMAMDIKQDCIEKIQAELGSQATMYQTLKMLGSDEFSEIQMFVFEVLFGAPNEEFFRLIRDSKSPIATLEEDVSGDVKFYGISFKRVESCNNVPIS